MTTAMSPELRARIAPLRLMAFDVDGILTDGRLWYGTDGTEYKAFDARDGHGLKMLRAAGITLAFITSRQSTLVARRARELGIDHCFQGVEAKLPCLVTLLGKCNLGLTDAGFMGDDLLDLPVLLRVGLAVTVPEAPEAVRKHVHHVTQRPGGAGAVREIAETILAGRGLLEPMIAEYLK